VNLRYLGDALDHWKGSMFEHLQRADLLYDFAVDAMMTDCEVWQPEGRQLYANLLRVEQSQIVEHERLLTLERSAYFREIQHRGKLFLDPDTGIATGRHNSKHIRPTEVHDLLDEQPDRILAVYQHIRGRRTHERVEEVVEALEQSGQPPSCCSYESGTVAMLFLSRNTGRVDDVRRAFEKLLGAHVDRRVYCQS
jgi:hypothetical protein